MGRMVFVLEGQHDSSQARSARGLEFGRFQSVARSGQNSLDDMSRQQTALTVNCRLL